jgi:hypothetical protein
VKHTKLSCFVFGCKVPCDDLAWLVDGKAGRIDLARVGFGCKVPCNDLAWLVDDKAGHVDVARVGFGCKVPCDDLVWVVLLWRGLFLDVRLSKKKLGSLIRIIVCIPERNDNLLPIKSPKFH